MSETTVNVFAVRRDVYKGGRTLSLSDTKNAVEKIIANMEKEASKNFEGAEVDKYVKPPPSDLAKSISEQGVYHIVIIESKNYFFRDSWKFAKQLSKDLSAAVLHTCWCMDSYRLESLVWQEGEVEHYGKETYPE